LSHRRALGKAVGMPAIFSATGWTAALLAAITTATPKACVTPRKACRSGLRPAQIRVPRTRTGSPGGVNNGAGAA